MTTHGLKGEPIFRLPALRPPVAPPLLEPMAFSTTNPLDLLIFTGHEATSRKEKVEMSNHTVSKWATVREPQLLLASLSSVQ
jgi:hypothetical protein